MSQAVVKTVTSSGTYIPTPNLAVIPGLEANLLTGAGWLRITAMIWWLERFGGGHSLTMTLNIDGVTQSAVPGAESITESAANQYNTAFLDYIVRLGAGQHTIELWAKVGHATHAIVGRQATLIIHELGF